MPLFFFKVLLLFFLLPWMLPDAAVREEETATNTGKKDTQNSNLTGLVVYGVDIVAGGRVHSTSRVFAACPSFHLPAAIDNRVIDTKLFGESFH